MNIVVQFLTLGPNDMGQSIGQGVICGLAGCKFLAEYNRCDTILFVACGQSQILFAAKHFIKFWSRSVSAVVVAHTTGHASSSADDHIGAVHGIEIVTRCVGIQFVLGIWKRKKNNNNLLIPSENIGILRGCHSVRLGVSSWMCDNSENL